ncbi:MAG: FHA domain-containing protein [Planctomycetes bacterium]|nr:FHA domain-containing protein [Planctomycetota bacterium]
MACLIVTKGQEVGKYFQLGNRTLAGGRDPSREIQIVDPTVSRKHFLIRKDGDGHAIVEMRAKNGIVVNGETYSEKKLADGDEIQVGETTLTYYDDDQPDRTNALEQFRAAGREYREDRTLSGG